MSNIDGRKESKDAQRSIRILAVKAFVEHKKPRLEIYKLFNVKRSALSKWINKYKKGGYAALEKDKRGTGKSSSKKLSSQKENAVKKIIETKTPNELGLPFLLWTREAIQQLIHERYKIRIAIRTISDWLKKWGFTFQKPAKRALEQNPEAVNKWLEEDYPKIHEKAKQEKAEIQWLDESGIQTNQNNRKTFAPKGQTPINKIPVKRCRCSYISSISNQGKMRFMVYESKFNAEKLITYLKRLIETRKQKIYVIMDNHPVHKSKKVKEWAEKNKEVIEVYYLPTYSPEVNPDEYLNRHLKSVIFKEERADSLQKLKKQIERELRKIQADSSLIASYFCSKLTSYAQAA